MVDTTLTNVEATFLITALSDYSDRLIQQIEKAESAEEVGRLEVYLTLAEDLIDLLTTGIEESQGVPYDH